jgi:hypothetical protein
VRRWPLPLGLASAAFLCAALAGATVVQKDNLRITLLAQVRPYKLPRTGTAPISVFIAGHLAAPKGGVPAQLRRLDIEVNRHALLRSGGLPSCRLSQLQPASSDRALANCADALLGSGRFWAHIVLPDQGAYPTHGRILIFNGTRAGRPVLLAHIFTSDPFFTSFVLVFSIKRGSDGRWGTKLSASLPEALGQWGYVDRIKLNLGRRYSYRGKKLSYFNAGCPAPRKVRRISFALARASFSFANTGLSLRVEKACAVGE